jgi:uncharacterized protein (DUF1330 family)
MKKQTLMLSVLSVIFLLSSMFQTLPVYAETKPKHMVEVIDLQPGKTIEDVREYIKRVAPVISKYGASNKQIFSVQKMGDKSNTAKVVLVWQIEDMKRLPKVFKDMAYTKHIPYRDNILNLKERIQFLGQKVK